MKNRAFWVLLLIVLATGAMLLFNTKAKNSYTILSISPTPTQKLYKNTQNGFQISYPSDWTYREADMKDGVAFRPVSKPNDYQYEYITISIFPKPLNIAALPFSEYVKVAAVSEIQNYQKLASIKSFVTADGKKGYVTTWMVQPLGGGKPTESLPIAYLPASEKQNSIEIFLNNKEYIALYTKMLATFAYTD